MVRAYLYHLFAEIKIIDFALGTAAKREDMLKGVGTTEYMAPELLRELVDCPDILTDIYALGCVSFALLTQRRPLSGKNNYALQMLTRAGKPFSTPLEVDPKVDDLVYAMVDHDRENRIQSVDEVIQRIDEIL